jgi:L-fuculose-phosphate aldolase
MYLDDPRFVVAAARRMLHNEGFESGIAGQVSVRDGDDDAFWTSPFGTFGETLPSDVQKLDLDCNLLSGGNMDVATSPAVGFHGEIYRQRPDVNAVIHTETFWVMVFATTEKCIDPYHDAAALHQDEQRWFTPVPGYSAIDRKLLAAALEDKSILFLKNHGVVVAAASIEAATTLTMDVEMMARVHLESKRAGGTPITDMDHIAEVKAGARKYRFTETWAAGMRRLAHEDHELFRFVIDQELRAHGYLGAKPSSEWRLPQ